MVFLAFRYLLARRRQTLLMLLGIFFGTAAFVSISGFMLGFRAYLVEQLINNSAHVHIQAREEFLGEHSLDQAFFGTTVNHVFWDAAPSGRKDSAMIESPQSWYARLDSDPRVKAYSPQLNAAVIMSLGKASVSAILIGCDARAQTRVSTIGDYVTQGDFEELATGGQRLAVGQELLKKLGLRIHQTVMVSLGNAAPVPFKVVAVFKTGNKQFDEQAYAEIKDVQKIKGTPNVVNKIAVRLYDLGQALSVATAWSRVSVEKVESWDQQNANLFSIFKIQDAVRFLSVGAIMVVAGFGIYNVLNMTVMQKRKDIAILRSMGYSTGNVVVLFFIQGLMLGFTGVALGLLFGYVFSFYLESIPFSGGPMGDGLGHLIVSRDPEIYFQAALLAFSSAMLASILPARSAGELAPIEIIRAGAE